MRPQAEARIRLCLAGLLSGRGRLDEAMRHVTVARDVAGLTASQRARLVGSASALPAVHGRVEMAESIARDGLRLAEECGDAIAHASSAYTLASVAFNRGQFGHSVEWASLPRLAGDDVPSARMATGWLLLNQGARIMRSQALLRLDRAADSNATLEAVRRSTTDTGFRSTVMSAHVLRVSHGFFLGGWDDAVTEFDALLDVCVELDELPISFQIAAGARALIAMHRGSPDTARATLADIGAPVPELGHLAALARALLIEVSGSSRAAFESLSTSWDLVSASGTAVVCITFATDLVRLAVAHGDGSRAKEVCDRIDAVAAANPGVASLRGTALRCRGLADGDADLLVDAATVLADSPRPLERRKDVRTRPRPSAAAVSGMRPGAGSRRRQRSTTHWMPRGIDRAPPAEPVRSG